MRATLLLLAVGLLTGPLAAQARPRSGARPAAGTAAQAADTANRITSGTVTGLRFRSIGPAVTGGRIGEVAIHPSAPRTWYVAVHSGGVWKTTNAGTTWTPIFDGEGSYSIGHLAIDPSDPLTIWVGTGENNSQRSVGYGDGVYQSTDGGRSWRNVGLKTSFHIGKIVVHPKDGNVVYVAATGSLWAPGGERGVYKTTDGGKTWTQSLKPENEWTGAQSLEIDPANPDVLYASTHQRARRQYGFINGGPGSALWKTTDAGATWSKVTRGLPSEELGKIGLAVSPVNPRIVYALVEAPNRAGGLFRSTDGGQNFERMSDYSPNPPMYYQKVYPDPKNADRIYLVDVQLRVSDDGGRTTRSIQRPSVHVDHHAVWIDPADTDHLIDGNDGGLYQSFDAGATWNFRGNLPITQFYKVDVDNALPFYNVCGGTQDNNSLCGPSQTINSHGQTNFDWVFVLGGDGFQPRVDPTDPNIIYAQLQHGELARFDRRTGETVGIQPQADPGEPALKWHWDSPLIISPHAHTRLYFASQRLFRSDDRGDSWRAVSPDLSRQIDRRNLKMMGRSWSVDAIARNSSTSFWGTIVSLAESPGREGLLWAGTDDGLIQVTEDGGGIWRRIGPIAGIPDTAFVADLEPSRHDPNTVYAAINNHKAGDLKPYLVKSTDLGRTWTSIAGNLPERGSVWTVVEDHVDPSLLFVGTEFGLWATVDGGQRWFQLKSGLPTIQIRDLAIQRRETDLVVATFGRGFYILHDYSPLRRLAATVAGGTRLFPVPEAKVYAPADPLGGGAKGSQGDALWTAPNPAFGATFTWYLKDALKSRRTRRLDAEKDAARKNAEIPVPSWEELRAEEREEAPATVLTVTDAAGNVIRRLTGPAAAGFQRLTWDLRYPPANPVTSLQPPGAGGGGPAIFGGGGPVGPLVPPGEYRVQLATRVDGVETLVGSPETFRAVPAVQATLPTADRAAVARFSGEVSSLQRAALGAGGSLSELETRLGLLARAIEQTAGAPAALRDTARALRTAALDLRTEFSGDQTVSGRNEPTPATITGRIQRVVSSLWQRTSGPTATDRRSIEVASRQLAEWLPRLRGFAERLDRLGAAAEAAGAPWTPGRIPSWRP